MIKGKSQQKFYLKTNKNINPLQKSKNSFNKNSKKKNAIQLEKEIQEITKKIEQERINLRMSKERLEQRKKILNKLQGKPITNLSLEEKERNRFIRRKEINNHKYNDPIKRKIGREREIIDAKIRREKEKEKNANEFERLGEEIDILVEDNRLLTKEVQTLRKRKLELEKLKEKMIKENKNKENELNEILRRIYMLEKNIKNNKYKRAVEDGIQQEKDFYIIRDELENEYQKVVQEYIKKERENLKEKAFKKQIEEMRNSIGGKGKKMNTEIKNELQRIEDEKINDRTPILDECLQKWQVVNKQKKDTINKYINNYSKIREAFENLAIYLDLTSISYLPEIYQKTEQKLSNINFQIERLENEEAQLENEKDTLLNQIELLKSKKNGMKAYRQTFIQQKKEKIKIIGSIAEKLNKDINIMEALFHRIKPETDNFLTKLNDTFISEFVVNKANLNKDKKYNYKTIKNYLSNIEDYWNILQSLEIYNADNYDIIDKQNFDDLREDMKEKLEGFEAKRIMNKSLYNSMNIERQKGKELNEIIKKTSNLINEQIKTPKAFRKNKSKYNKSSGYNGELTEDENLKYGNDSLGYQQSSIYYPNNSSLVK